MHEEIPNEDKQIRRGADHPLPGMRLTVNASIHLTANGLQGSLPGGAILRQAEGGVAVAELCRAHGMMPLPGR